MNRQLRVEKEILWKEDTATALTKQNVWVESMLMLLRSILTISVDSIQ